MHGAYNIKHKDVHFVRLCEVSFRMRILVITIKKFKIHKQWEIPRQPEILSGLEENILRHLCLYRQLIL